MKTCYRCGETYDSEDTLCEPCRADMNNWKEVEDFDKATKKNGAGSSFDETFNIGVALVSLLTML